MKSKASLAQSPRTRRKQPRCARISSAEALEFDPSASGAACVNQLHETIEYQKQCIAFYLGQISTLQDMLKEVKTENVQVELESATLSPAAELSTPRKEQESKTIGEQAREAVVACAVSASAELEVKIAKIARSVVPQMVAEYLENADGGLAANVAAEMDEKIASLEEKVTSSELKVVSVVVEHLVGRLPALVSPAIQTSLQTSLQSSLKDAVEPMSGMLSRLFTRVSTLEGSLGSESPSEVKKVEGDPCVVEASGNSNGRWTIFPGPSQGPRSVSSVVRAAVCSVEYPATQESRFESPPCVLETLMA